MSEEPRAKKREAAARFRANHPDYGKEYRRAHPEQIRATRIKSRARPEAKRLAAAATKLWRARNRERCRETRKRYYVAHKEEIASKKRADHFKKKYSLSEAQVFALAAVQLGRCKICGAFCPDQLCVDHSHADGHVRGMLCPDCNLGLGRFKDSPELLEGASTYVRGT